MHSKLGYLLHKRRNSLFSGQYGIFNLMVYKMNIDDIQFFTADSMPYGETYGQWTVKWWRWFLSTPKSINPVLDPTGEYAYVNQPSVHVWFLGGKVVEEERNLPNRFCRIPNDKSILFPVINCEANPLEYPELRTHKDLIERVKTDEDTIDKKECFVNGNRIPVQRVKSDPAVFELSINEDNGANIKGGGNTYASADGYWVFLKPLPLGEYTLSFSGSCEYGKLNSGANYHLQIY
jgi:hypothetical protein